eukprot:gene39115-52144_t
MANPFARFRNPNAPPAPPPPAGWGWRARADPSPKVPLRWLAIHSSGEAGVVQHGTSPPAPAAAAAAPTNVIGRLCDGRAADELGRWALPPAAAAPLLPYFPTASEEMARAPSGDYAVGQGI